ncbi:MAG: ribonuclease HII [Bacteroidales bacterium]|nr:ribonuclease HII [Bacteroidales bacterium]
MIEHYTAAGLECGLDEAGRGCLAGPVFAAAVVLQRGQVPPGLNDSKKLSPGRRKELRDTIEDTALAWAVGRADAQEIDQINILQASFLAMHRAIEQLSLIPDILLVDGNRFLPFRDLPYVTLVGGDARYAAIAAASILAKTYRDDFMENISLDHPQYGWRQNKGYPTPEHIRALMQYGHTPWHRRSFSVKGQYILPL